MDWSLLGCGAKGHITFAPDEPALRERLSVSTREGPAWRCLRCGTFVIGQPTSSGPVSAAPRVRRGRELRSAFILRLFAIERFFRALLFAALAFAIWRFRGSRMSIEEAYSHELPALRSLLRGFGFNVHHSKLLGLIQHAFTLTPRTLTWLALAAAAYAAIEIVEGTGLWLLRRWGEYFAAVATSVGLPYEIYDLTAKVTVLRVVAFAINLALVIYLVVTKRLFGVRGGKKAYEARLRSASILQDEIDAVAATPVPATAAGSPGTGQAVARAGPPPARGAAPDTRPAGQPAAPDTQAAEQPSAPDTQAAEQPSAPDTEVAAQPADEHPPAGHPADERPPAPAGMPAPAPRPRHGG